GTKGRHGTHRFAVRHVLALTWSVHCWCHPVRGCVRMDFLRETYRDGLSWSPAAVEHMLGLRDDEWSEEAFAKALQPQPREPGEPRMGEVTLHPSDLKQVKDLVRRLTKLRRAVRKRLGAGRGRTPSDRGAG